MTYIFKSSVPIRIPEEVIPARVTTLTYTTMQKKTRIPSQNSRKLDCPAIMQIRCIWMYNDYFIDKAKFLSDDSLVMAKRAILKEISDKPKSDLGFSFRT